MKTSVLETLTPKYVVDNSGEKTEVLLDLKTFTTMVEELEDLYDIMQAEKILARGFEEEGSTLEELEKSLKEED